MLDKDITGTTITSPQVSVPVSKRRIKSLTIDFNTGDLYVNVDYGDDDGAGGIAVKKTKRFRVISGPVYTSNVTQTLRDQILTAVQNGIDSLDADATLINGTDVIEL